MRVFIFRRLISGNYEIQLFSMWKFTFLKLILSRATGKLCDPLRSTQKFCFRSYPICIFRFPSVLMDCYYIDVLRERSFIEEIQSRLFICLV